MNKNVLFILLIIASVIIWRIIEKEDRTERVVKYNNVLKYLQNSNELCNSKHHLIALKTYIKELENYFNQNYHININQTYKKDHLNIILADLREYFPPDKKTSSGIKPFLSNLSMNMIADSPNILYIDNFLFMGIFMIQNSESVTFSQLMDNSFQGYYDSIYGEGEVETYETMGAIENFNRLTIIEEIAKGNYNLFETYDSATTQFLNEGIIEAEIFFKATKFAFLPLLTHEIAHLENDKNIDFFTIFQKIYSRLLKKEHSSERIADSIANSVVVELLKNEDGYGRFLINAQMIVSSYKFIRDIYLFHILRDIRGLNTKDLLMNVFPKNNRPFQIPTSPYVNYQDIKFGKINSLPALTRNEFDDITKRISNFKAGGGHDHFFNRAFKLSGLIDSIWGDFSIRSAFLGYMPLLADFDSTYYNWFGISAPMPPLDLKIDDFILDNFKLDTSINFSNNKTHIAIHKYKDKGWIEFIGDKENLEQIKFVMRRVDYNNRPAKDEMMSGLDYVKNLRIAFNRHKKMDSNEALGYFNSFINIISSQHYSYHVHNDMIVEHYWLNNSEYKAVLFSQYSEMDNESKID